METQDGIVTLGVALLAAAILFSKRVRTSQHWAAEPDRFRRAIETTLKEVG